MEAERGQNAPYSNQRTRVPCMPGRPDRPLLEATNIGRPPWMPLMAILSPARTCTRSDSKSTVCHPDQTAAP